MGIVVYGTLGLIWVMAEAPRARLPTEMEEC